MTSASLPRRPGNSLIALPIISRAEWISSSVMTKGGAKRMIFSCVGLACFGVLRVSHVSKLEKDQRQNPPTSPFL